MSGTSLRDSKDVRFLDHCDGIVWMMWLEGKRGEWVVKKRTGLYAASDKESDGTHQKIRVTADK